MEADFEQEMWQPWKSILPGRYQSGFASDHLDHTYGWTDIVGGYYAGRRTPMRGLGVEEDQRVDYLIL